VGQIQRIWDRKPALLTALENFFLGSFMSGVSTSMSILITGRAVQGSGGSGLLILENICASDLFSMRTRGLVYGMESLIWAAVAALGLILGGAFAELVEWRWCFYIAHKFARI
jgi:MFS family permease